MKANLYSRRRQRGAVTLVITLLVMIAMTIGSFSLVQTSALETKMTANDQRNREALHAAQSGIDFLLAHLAQDPIDVSAVCNEDHWEDHRFVLNFDGPPDGGGAIDFNPDNQVISCLNVPYGLVSRTNVWSRGFSQDRESVRTIVSIIDLTNSWSWGYSLTEGGGGAAGMSPIVARGGMTGNGNIDVGVCPDITNCIELDVNGANPNIRDANRVLEDDDGNALTLINTGGDFDLNGNAADFSEESNVSSNQTTLAALSEAALFEAYTTKPAAWAYPDLIGIDDATWTLANAIAQAETYTPSGSAGTDGDELATVKSDVIYVDGPLSINGGTVGSPGRPVTLIVNGDFEIRGNATVWGTVFVREGNPDDPFDSNFSSGTNRILGSLVLSGDVTSSGNAGVYFNEAVASGGVPDLDPTRPAETSERVVSARIGSWREVVR